MPDENTLSGREEEILQLVATGMTNREIAQELYISPNTVKVHLRNIFEKIGVSSRTEATLYGIEQGIVNVPGGAALVDTTAPSWREEISKFTWVWVGIGLLLLAFLVTFSSNVLFPSPTPESAAIVVAANTLERWAELAPIPEPRASLASASYDGNIFAIAGEGPEGVSGSVFRYLTEEDTWERLSDKPTPVSEVDGVLIGEKIYVPGGKLGNGQPTDVLEIYDPRRDTWERGASLPKEISAYALADFEGQMYLFGGWDGEKVLDIVLRYDPLDDRWEEVPSMPSARAYAGAAAAGGKIYVIGGWDGSEAIDVNESYSPSRNLEGERAWEVHTKLPTAKQRVGVESLAGIVFVVGDSEVWQYTTRVDSWNVDEGELPYNSVSNFGFSASESFMFIIGGRNEKDGIINQIYRYQAIYSLVIPIIINQ